MKRLLVTGATGLLGSALVRAAASRYEVHGLARHPEAAPIACATHAADLTAADAVARVVADIEPDVVVHTAAFTHVDGCERDPDAARRQNVQATANVVRALASAPARVLHVSTDAVFDGTRGGYTETDTPAPLSVYSRTKLEAEHVVRGARPDALIARTVFSGWNALPKQSLGEWVLGRLRGGANVPGFVDVRFSPLFADTLARVLLDLAETPAAGVLHVGSRDGCSKFDFARMVAAAFGYPEARVVPTRSDDVPLVAPRARDLTLDVARAEAELRRALPTVAQDVAAFAAAAPTAVTA
ncbi:MAG: SDR family oxidoreductase [Candidatus Rokubacteria bacterium]|nr:SDR family oxidoreductase [Candidatus Rokubacteria bacterium]